MQGVAAPLAELSEDRVVERFIAQCQKLAQIKDEPLSAKSRVAQKVFPQL
jgi:hypothetical protein